MVFALCSESTGTLNFLGTSSSAYDFGCFTAAIPTPTALLWGTRRLDNQKHRTTWSLFCVSVQESSGRDHFFCPKAAPWGMCRAARVAILTPLNSLGRAWG